MLENKKPRRLEEIILTDALKGSSAFSRGSLRNMAYSLDRKAADLDKQALDLAAQYAYDPSAAGLGDRTAIISEDAWVIDALRLMNKDGPSVWLRSMLDTLRKRFGGHPLLSIANKNHACPCGSTKKFGKCCGRLVEEQDPDSCRTIGHEYGLWGKIKDQVWARSCEKCAAVETCTEVLEIGCEGDNVISIPCRGCSALPDRDTAWEIYSNIKKMHCLACKGNGMIKLLSIEHMDEGKHVGKWTATTLRWEDSIWTFELGDHVGPFIVHTKCLKDQGISVNEKV